MSERDRMPDTDNASAFLHALDKHAVERLTHAVMAEWGEGDIDNREPYRTNAASRAVYAVLRTLERMSDAR